jgi:glycosyltransferase involved in cell wall biosynthesis
MKICQLHSGNLYGGVETFMVTLAHQRAHCPEMHYALCFEGRLSRELAEQGINLHFLGNARLSRPWSVWRACRNLRSLLRREQFDVVISNSSWTQALFGPVLHSARRPPLVYWLHGPIQDVYLLDHLAKWTVPDLLVGVSRHTAESGARLYPKVRTEVLHYPTPLSLSRPRSVDRHALRAQLHTPPDATVIIQASRMEPWKGHAMHLEALGRLRHLPGWVCWQVGGPQRPFEATYFAGLKELAQRLGIADRVHFLGLRADVPDLLQAADIFCQANRGPEGFSLAFIEAFSTGLPIVTTALGGAPEIVDDNCGVLVPPGDVPALAAGLEKLILDPSLRQQMGTAGRSKVQLLCDPATQLAKLSRLLADLVNGRKTVERSRVSAGV